MIESEIKELTNLITKWRTCQPITVGEGCVFRCCARELENVLNILAPPGDPEDAIERSGHLNGEESTPESMLEQFDNTACPECGRKLDEAES